MNIIKMLTKAKTTSKDYIDGYITVEDGKAFGRIGNVFFKDISVIEENIAAILGAPQKSRGINNYEFAYYNGERVAVYDNF